MDVSSFTVLCSLFGWMVGQALSSMGVFSSLKRVKKVT
jgi:hypothetical protein